MLAALNLRGVRESGGLFAVPTYCFMAGVLVMIGWGLFRILVLGEPLRAESAQYTIEAEPRYADVHAASGWSRCWPARSPPAARR